MEWLMNFISSTDYLFLEFNLFTSIIIWIIIWVGVFSYIKKRDKDIITMIWIFWTFSWIIAGLYFFDEKDIDWSIPKLIWWLKTAFYTSLAGLWTTIILHLIEKQDESKDEIDFLKDIKTEIENWNSQNTLILQELKLLNKWIWWDSDNSLVNQIKLLKSDWNENHRELKKSFDDFAEKMAENNMKWLIEAIKQVMEDFNTKINDQLWESFKELTNAIDNLLKWQNEYKENIISSTNALNISKDSLEKSSKWFEITVEKSEKFVWVSEQLWGELKNLNSSLEIFKNWINEFDWMSEKFDWVVKNTKEMAVSMTESINTLTENFVSKAEKMVWESEKQIVLMKDTFSDQSKDLKESHKDVLDALKQELLNNSKQSSEEFLRMQWKLEEQVLEFDKKLWEELEKSLTTLWKQLTGLSGKFVSDYWNLAEKLERLVSLSNK